jgi:hypothetical protein
VIGGKGLGLAAGDCACAVPAINAAATLTLAKARRFDILNTGFTSPPDCIRAVFPNVGIGADNTLHAQGSHLLFGGLPIWKTSSMRPKCPYDDQCASWRVSR